MGGKQTFLYSVMKLHLPLGLLAAVLMSIGTVAHRAQAETIYTRAVFSSDDWERSALDSRVWNLDLTKKNSALVGNNWRISVTRIANQSETFITAGQNTAALGMDSPLVGLLPFYFGMDKDLAILMSGEDRISTDGNVRWEQGSSVTITILATPDQDDSSVLAMTELDSMTAWRLGFVTKNIRPTMNTVTHLSQRSSSTRTLFTDVSIDLVKDLNDAYTITWTGSENSVMGWSAKDMYHTYAENTLVDAWGLSAGAHLGAGNTGYEGDLYDTLRFVPAGEQMVASRTFIDDVEAIEVGKGQALTTGKDWAGLFLGGLRVEEGATGYSVSPGRDAGTTLTLGTSDPNHAGWYSFYADIHEDFSLGTAKAPWEEIVIAPAAQNYTLNISVDPGVTFSIYANADSDSPLENTVYLSGGGTLALHGDSFNLTSNTHFVITGQIFPEPDIDEDDGEDDEEGDGELAGGDGEGDGELAGGDGEGELPGDVPEPPPARPRAYTTLDMGGARINAAITLQHGALAHAENYTGELRIVNNFDDAAGRLSLGNVHAEYIRQIYFVSSAISLCDIGEGTLTISGTDNQVAIGWDSLTESPEGGRYALEFSAPEKSWVTFRDTEDEHARMAIKLDDEVMSALSDEEGGYEGRRYLWLTNARFTADEVDFTDRKQTMQWFREHFVFSPGVDFTYELEEGSDSGMLHFIVSTSHVWYTSKHGEMIDAIDRFDDPEAWKKVVVDTKLDLILTPKSNNPDANTIVLRYLSSGGYGLSDGALTITRLDPEDEDYPLVVELNNDKMLNGEEVLCDSTFNKDIVVKDAAGETILRKTGEGTLTINGDVTSNGSLQVAADGTLVLNGDNSTIGRLEKIDGTLRIDGTLAVTEDTDLRDGANAAEASTGSIVGSGTLVVESGDFQAGGRFSEANSLLLQVEKDATVHLAEDTSSIFGGLAGEGTLDLGGSAFDTTVTLDGKSARFSGTLTSDGSGTIHVLNEGTKQTLDTAGVQSWDLHVTHGGTLEIIGEGDADKRARAAVYRNVVVGGSDTYDNSKAGHLIISAQGSGSTYTAGSTLKANSARFGEDAIVEFRYNFAGVEGENLNHVAPMLETTGNIYISGYTTFLLNSTGSMFGLQQGSDLVDMVLMRSTDGIIDGYYDNGDELLFDTSGVFMIFYRDIDVRVRDNEVVLNARVQHENVFAALATDETAAVGGHLLWAARFCPAMNDQDSLFYRMVEYTATQAIKGDRHEASRVMASVAGSTLPTLGTAQRDAVRAQLNRLRDHASTTMGLNTANAYEDMPFYHCWIEGAGHFANLKGEGLSSGYKLNSWGGSVGADVDVDSSMSVGIALTALYGDYTAGSADHAKGDMDNVFLSFVGQYRQQSWSHTLVASFGLTDVDVNRTVDCGVGSYTTHGSTSGWGLAMMYELARNYELNEDGTSVLQPLLNLSITKTSLRGFRESGQKDLALNVSKQEWTSASVGVGMRWKRQMGTTVFDRSAQLELRAMVAHDLGDTRGEAGVALQANPGSIQRMKCEEAGATSLQLGAGLNVPLQEDASIFTNVSADLRSGMHSWNVSAGFRYSF